MSCGSATRLWRADEGAMLAGGDVNVEIGELVEEESVFDDTLVDLVDVACGVGVLETIPRGKAEGGAVEVLLLSALDLVRWMDEAEGVRLPNSVTPEEAVLYIESRLPIELEARGPRLLREIPE